MSGATARLHPSILIGILLLGLFTAGCRAPEEEQVEGAWHQVDLWQTRPRLSGLTGDATAIRQRWETLRRREIGVLEQRPDQQLEWRLELGDEPRLSFRPVSADGDCVYEVAARDSSGTEKALFKESFPRRGDNLERVVTVDLAAYQRTAIDLIFRAAAADAATCSVARWGSPAVASRKKAPRRKTGKPNILLIGADTLRADALGVYGRRPSVTPALDRLAEESDVWLEAFTCTNSTNPSFSSLMTGLYAKNHGTFDMRTRLPKSATTLAELLRREGYATHAVLSVKHLGKIAGLEQGFDRFEYPRGQSFAETAVNTAIDRLQAIDEPFFLWLHLFDPHVPHNPPQPYATGYRAEAVAGMRPVESWTPFREIGERRFTERVDKPLLGHPDLYGGEVAYLDRQVDRLLDFLRSRELLDRTVTAFVADHGETLGDRGRFYDHVGLHDDTTHVPLMIRWPGQQSGRRIAGLVQHFDLFPTLLEAAGIAPPPQDGVSLKELERRGGRRAVFAEHALEYGEMIRTADHKYWLMRSKKKDHVKRYFYDLRQDPLETRNLAGKVVGPAEARLAAALDGWRSRRRDLEKAVPVEISDEDRRLLEALGYVE